MEENKKSISFIHMSKQGKVSDKWQLYLQYYDQLFLPFQDDKISLLEIGIQNGGSLETYAQYFKNAKRIVGCDIDEKCKILQFEDKRIKTVIGDVNNKNIFKKIYNIESQFDIIIDDGSHVSSDIIKTFFSYFNLVKPGGVFVIEDVHTIYNPSYGGGIVNDSSAMSFFKKLVDIVNYQWWTDQISIHNYLSTFCNEGVPKFILDGWIDSIEFRNSLITVRKSLVANHNKIGNRIISGQHFHVQKFT